jgi:hypothetical protein
MGRRLYLPSTGRFLSVDPVPGGSANAYDYCNADPVNCTDLNGTFAWKKFAGIVAAVASVASMVPGPVGMAAAAVSVVAYYAAGDRKQAAFAAAGIVLAAVGAGAAVAVAKMGLAGKAVEGASSIGRLASRVVSRSERSDAVTFAERSLQKFTTKHGADFGVVGNTSKATMEQAATAVRSHLASPLTASVRGAYRSQPALLHLNVVTRRIVVTDRSMAFVTGYRASARQVFDVIVRRKLW